MGLKMNAMIYIFTDLNTKDISIDQIKMENSEFQQISNNRAQHTKRIQAAASNFFGTPAKLSWCVASPPTKSASYRRSRRGGFVRFPFWPYAHWATELVIRQQRAGVVGTGCKVDPPVTLSHGLSQQWQRSAFGPELAAIKEGSMNQKSIGYMRSK